MAILRGLLAWLGTRRSRPLVFTLSQAPAWYAAKWIWARLGDANLLGWVLQIEKPGGPGLIEYLSNWPWLLTTAAGFGWLWYGNLPARRRVGSGRGRQRAQPASRAYIWYASACISCAVISAFLIGRAFPFEGWLLDRAYPLAGISLHGDKLIARIDGAEIFNFMPKYEGFKVFCRRHSLLREFTKETALNRSDYFSIVDAETNVQIPCKEFSCSSAIESDGIQCRVGLVEGKYKDHPENQEHPVMLVGREILVLYRPNGPAFSM